MALTRLNTPTGISIPSAANINLDSPTAGNQVHVTGSTAITSVTLTSGNKTIIFDGVLTLTHNATSNNLPGGVNITTAVGDRALYVSDGTTVYCISYIKASGIATTTVASGVQIDYTARATLRAMNPTIAATALVEGLGVFYFVLGSTELDDDETCFATTSGCWLLQAVHYDMVDAVVSSAISALETPKTYLGQTSNTLAGLGANVGVSFTMQVLGCNIGMPVLVGFSVYTANMSAFGTATGPDLVTVLVNANGNGATLPSGIWTAIAFEPQQSI